MNHLMMVEWSCFDNVEADKVLQDIKLYSRNVNKDKVLDWIKKNDSSLITTEIE